MAAPICQQMALRRNISRFLRQSKCYHAARLQSKKNELNTLINRHFKGTIASSRSTSDIKTHKSALSKPSSNHQTNDQRNTVTKDTELDSEKDEDFFGIPADFKLQHARMEGPAGKKEVSEYFPDHLNPQLSEDGVSATTETECSVTAQTRARQRQRKANTSAKNKTTLVTSFGLVSFDRSSDAAGSEMQQRAQEILKTKIGGFQTDQREDTKLHKSNPALDIEEQYFGSLSDIEKLESLSEQDSKMNYFDEQYFSNQFDEEEKKNRYKNSKEPGPAFSSKVSDVEASNRETGSHFIDEQFFSGVTEDLPKISNQGPDSQNNLASLDKIQPQISMSEVDQQYFGESLSQRQTEVNLGGAHSLKDVAGQYLNDKHNFDTVRPMLPKRGADRSSISYQRHESSSNSLERVKRSSMVKDDLIRSTQPGDSEQKTASQGELNLSNDRYSQDILTNDRDLNQQNSRGKAYASKLNAAMSDSSSALNVALSFRQNLQQKEQDDEALRFKIPKAYDTTDTDNDGEELVSKKYKFDNKGYRILDAQVPNFNEMTSADVVRMLKSRIIFNHDDFLAIDKPYGLPSIGQKNDRLSVSGLLPSLLSILPHRMQAEELHIVSGLDRDVTGALILAKTPEAARTLKDMLRSSEGSIKRYWAITKGAPKPPEGTLDIPVGDALIGGSFRRLLRPLYKHTGKPGVKLSKAPSERAITEYKVLSRSRNTALLECTPLTSSVKHQLRVHLAFGLNTPILGDHKYSHFSRLAPQKLDVESLTLLRIRQAKVRHLALHLHLRSLILTDYGGRMIFLTTRPPLHFADNLRSLKLQMPQK